MQIGLRELLGVCSIAGVVVGGMCQPNPFFELLVVNFTFFLMLLSVPLAIGCQGEKRVFWIAFGVTVLVYLFAFNTIGSPTEKGPLLTRKLLHALHVRIHPKHYEPPVDPFGINPFGDDNDGLFEEEVAPEGETDDLFGTMETECVPFSDLSKFHRDREKREFKSSLVLIGTMFRLPPLLGLSVSYRYDSPFYAFFRIGHCASALLIGWMMGHLAQFMYRRTLS